MRRASGDRLDESLVGLFAPPAAFVGSGPCVRFEGVSISPQARADAQAYMNRELSKIGVVELAQLMGGSRLDSTPPAYSVAAKKAMEKFKGRKTQLFLEEAGNCFSLYIRPQLLTYPPEVIQMWSAQFGPADNEEAWFQNALAQLPALHNYIDIMVVADSLPDRKDAYNHFMDNEIMVAPLAYTDVFVSRDNGVRDLLRSRTKILSRNKAKEIGLGNKEEIGTIVCPTHSTLRRRDSGRGRLDSDAGGGRGAAVVRIGRDAEHDEESLSHRLPRSHGDSSGGRSSCVDVVSST